MNVVVAPDSFKGSLGAAEVAAALATGWHQVRPDDRVTEIPLADGGEGTLAALRAAVAHAELIPVRGVTGPDGAPVDADYLRLPDGSAVVELARSSGLPLMRRLDPLHATTRGLGEVLAAALDAGASRLLVAVGGSASTDGGAGALAALGVRLTDEGGAILGDGGEALTRLAHVDLARLRPPPTHGVDVLTDVDAVLLGPHGAAAVFGPQKGASAEDIRTLERGLTRWAAALGGDPQAAGAGAAGGTAYGLATLWRARLVSGSDAIAAAAGLDNALDQADLVISGEGAFDRTSLAGKVVGVVLARARRRGRPVCVVAGSVDRRALGSVAAAVSLTDLAGSRDRSFADPVGYLRRAGEHLARSADNLRETAKRGLSGE